MEVSWLTPAVKDGGATAARYLSRRQPPLSAPERFCQFGLDFPLRQTEVAQVTLIEVGKRVPLPDPLPPGPEQRANPPADANAMAGCRVRF
jgi:hypothetical protein